VQYFSEWLPNEEHRFTVGGKLSRFYFAPEQQRLEGEGLDTLLESPVNTQAWRASAFLEYRRKLGSFTFVPNLRVTRFSVGGTAYTDFTSRWRLHYRLNASAAFQVAFDQLVQHIHLLTNSSLGLPSDLWVPSTANTSPQRGQQFSAGYFQELKKGWRFSLEAYFKNMQGLIEYSDAAAYNSGISPDWEEEIVIGDGEAYGLEWQLERNEGKFQGMLAYTLAWSWRQFEEIDFGERFPYKYDRRHDVALNLRYHLRKRKIFSLNFVYSTGNALTVPIGRYQGVLPPNYNPNTKSYREGIESRPLFAGRNAFRMPAYHRLDVGYEDSKAKKNGRVRTWTVSVYNAYNRLNPYFIYLFRYELRQFTLFPIIPSVGYKLAF